MAISSTDLGTWIAGALGDPTGATGDSRLSELDTDASGAVKWTVANVSGARANIPLTITSEAIIPDGGHNIRVFSNVEGCSATARTWDGSDLNNAASFSVELSQKKWLDGVELFYGDFTNLPTGSKHLYSISFTAPSGAQVNDEILFFISSYTQSSDLDAIDGFDDLVDPAGGTPSATTLGGHPDAPDIPASIPSTLPGGMLTVASESDYTWDLDGSDITDGALNNFSYPILNTADYVLGAVNTNGTGAKDLEVTSYIPTLSTDVITWFINYVPVGQFNSLPNLELPVGTYNIRAMIDDGVGGNASDEHTITIDSSNVLAPATPPFTALPPIGTVGLSYNWGDMPTENVNIIVGEGMSISELILGELDLTGLADPTTGYWIPAVNLKKFSGDLPPGILYTPTPNDGTSSSTPYADGFGPHIVPFTGTANAAGSWEFVIRATIAIVTPVADSKRWRAVGYSWTVDKTVNITVSTPSTPPKVEITSPADGSTSIDTAGFSLSATAFGYRQGIYSADLKDYIVWSSDIQDPIDIDIYTTGDQNTGNTGFVTLEEGVHTLTATCVDPLTSDEGSDSVKVTVTAAPPSYSKGNVIEWLTVTHEPSDPNSENGQQISVEFYVRKQGNVNGTYDIQLLRGGVVVDTISGTVDFAVTVGPQDPDIDPTNEYEVVTCSFINVEDSLPYKVKALVDGFVLDASLVVPDRTPPIIVELLVQNNDGEISSGRSIPYQSAKLEELV
jgi:hypothetical protein